MDRAKRGDRCARDERSLKKAGKDGAKGSESEDKTQCDRSRSRQRKESETSKDNFGREKKERRFREEKAKPNDSDIPRPETDSPLPTVVEELASMVATSGEELEEAARSNSSRAPDLDFLDDQSCSLYTRYRARVTQLKSDGRQEGKRKRKSRWGAQETPVLELVPGGPGLALPTALGTVVAPTSSRGTERSPAMKAYAAKIFGGVELTEDQWKHCEIQLQVGNYSKLALLLLFTLLDLPMRCNTGTDLTKCADEYIDDLEASRSYKQY